MPATAEPQPPVTLTRDQPADAKNSLRPLIIRAVIGVAVVLALIFGIRAWWHAHSWVETDDAFLAAHVQQVSSRISGRVETVPVRDNQLVHAGDLLVQLDDRDLQVAVQQAEAKLASAQADVAKAEAQKLAAESAAAQAVAQLESTKAKADNSEIELNRSKRLRETGAVAQQELDTAIKNSISDNSGVTAAEKQINTMQAGIRYTTAAMEASKASVTVAESDLAKAKLNLSYATITAKQDGRVTVKSVEPGNYVQPGQALMAVVSNEVWVEANFKETQLKHVRPGQPAVVHVDAYPGLELHGRVDSIQAGSGAQFSLLPPENATGNYVKVVQRVPVKITVDLPKEDVPLLGPGMSVVPEIRVRN